MDLDRTAFAVVDVETTGFVPGTHRIVEIAAVLVEPGCELRVGLDTVLDAPGARATFEIHRIPQSLTHRAPSFEAVSGKLLRCLAGRVVVGHNLAFDLRHITSELGRQGLALPPFATVDTMALDACLTGQGRRTLDAACAAHGIHRERAHAAGTDAVDTARLLERLLQMAAERGIRTLDQLLAAVGAGQSAPVLPPSAAEIAADVPFEAVSRYAHWHEQRTSIQEYGQLLTVALSDTALTEQEAHALQAFRASHTLAASQVRAMHAQVFAAAILLFCQDGLIDDGEVRYLRRLRQALSDAGWAPGDEPALESASI